ncbi:MAG: stage III sporulation protein AE [Eubacteriaceae bacterium]|nr:stage III sporulation protein AE [Eubacteriaceae bacterium]
MNFDEILKEQMKNYVNSEDTDSISDYAGRLSEGISDYFTIDRILDATLNGKSIFQDSQLITDLKSLFFYEIKGAVVIAAEIIIVCLIIGLLKNMSNSFGESGVTKIATMICGAVIVGLAMTNFYEIYNLTAESVKTITYTMGILLPILIALVIAMGQVASGTIMSPLLLSAVTFFETVIKNIVIPMIFISTVLTFLNCLTEKDYVNHIAKFIRKTALVVTGLILTIMTGIITVQGLIVKTTDSILMGTARYSLDTFIPIVGGFASDTIDLFLKCMGSIKNVVGVFGILTVIVLIMVPILKIITVAVIYKVTGLILEPFAGKKLSEGVFDIGSSLISMGAVLLLSSFLFVIFISAIISIGGV